MMMAYAIANTKDRSLGQVWYQGTLQQSLLLEILICPPVVHISIRILKLLRSLQQSDLLSTLVLELLGDYERMSASPSWSAAE